MVEDIMYELYGVISRALGVKYYRVPSEGTRVCEI